MNSKRLAGIALIVAGAGVLIFAMLRPSTPEFGDLVIAAQPGSNVVLVTLDTTRADHLGCYGGSSEVTPIIDMLSTKGITFMDMQAVAPITLPSHTSMLTGLYPYSHGVRNNGMFSVPEELETLASVFGNSGYATGAFVSASVLAKRFGLDRDFDVYDDDLSMGSHVFQRGVPARRGDLTVTAATQWIDGLPDGKPFFCWIHLYDPHAPYDPPPEFARKFPDDPYTGEIAFTDNLIGRVLEFLNEHQIADSTILSVVADHGEALGEHGEKTHAILLHQATTKVPWVLTGPGIPPGVRFSKPTSGVDVPFTLAALAGLAPPNGERAEGVNVFGPHEDEFFQHRNIFSETLLPRYQYGWSRLLGIRRGPWQLIDGVYSELFDLANDPREFSNRLAAETTVAEDLKNDLQPVIEQGDDDTTRLELSKSELDQLIALGYAASEASERPDPLDPRQMIFAHVNFEKARQFLEKGNDEMALEALNKALTDDPNNVAVLGSRAQLYMQTGRTDEAREDLALCMQLDPDNAGIYAGMARLELREGNYDKAIELATIGSGKRGAFENLSVVRAIALTQSGRPDEAVRFIEARLEENPEDPDLLGYRGELYLRDEQLDKAEEYLRMAVTNDALHSQSRFRLAHLLSQTGRKPEAVAVLENLLKIEPGNTRALAAIGEIKIDDPNAARAYLEESVRLDPNGYEGLVNLGRCYIQLGLGTKAEAALRRALEIRPGDISARNNLSASLILQNRPSDAEELLTALLEEKPSFVEARNNLALVLGRMGRMDDAEAQARKAIGYDATFIDARLTLSSILSSSDRAAEAVALLEPFAGETTLHPDFAKHFGIALVRSGHTDQAMTWLEKANEHENSTNAEVLIGMGQCYEAQGDSLKARQCYQRAAQVTPNPKLRATALDAVERLSTSG